MAACILRRSRRPGAWRRISPPTGLDPYFTKSWGYDPSLVALGIDWVEEGLPAFEIEDVAKALAVFARDEPDCNYSVMTGKIVTFLKELIEADGRIHPNEERELERVQELFERIE